MNRILVLLFIGAITFIILLFILNPEMLNDVWLYGVGLIGLITKLTKSVVAKLKSFIDDLFKETESSQKNKELTTSNLKNKQN